MQEQSLHQCSSLSSLMFVIAMEAIPSSEMPYHGRWYMKNADDLILIFSGLRWEWLGGCAVLEVTDRFTRNGLRQQQQQQQSFYSPLSGVPEETFTHPPSWSSSNLYQLLPPTMIHSILPVQITCLAIFLYNLSPRPLWSSYGRPM